MAHFETDKTLLKASLSILCITHSAGVNAGVMTQGWSSTPDSQILLLFGLSVVLLCLYRKFDR